MKKIHLLHYLLLCYMVLAVATSCGDDEDDYAPDNVNDPEKLTDPLPTTDQFRRNTQQHALLPFVLEQRRPYDIREHDKPLQGRRFLMLRERRWRLATRSSLPGRTLTGFSRIPICWLTSRICSISGAS